MTWQFQSGLSCTYTPTSDYVTFTKVPGTGRNLEFDVAHGATSLVDVRFMRSLVSESSQFTNPTTTFVDVSSGFYGNTTKSGHTFAIQARQSTNSTEFSGTVTIRWMCLE